MGWAEPLTWVKVVSWMPWLARHWYVLVGGVIAALGCALLMWSSKPLAGGADARPEPRGKLARWLDARLNRPWQASVAVTFAVATALVSLGLGTLVDRFGPAPDKQPADGRYVAILWLVGGAGLLALGLGAALWRGRVNQELGLGTAIVIDERLSGFSPTEHELFAARVRQSFHRCVFIPRDLDEPIWRLGGQDWHARVDRLTQNLALVRQLDTANTPTSLFLKAPWAVSMALGSRLHGAGGANESLRVRAFPADRRPAGLPDPAVLARMIQPDAYFAFSDTGSESPGAPGQDGASPRARGTWLRPPAAPEADQRLVITIRVPANRCGPLPARAAVDAAVALTQQFTLVDQGFKVTATDVLDLGIDGVGSGVVVDHRALPTHATAITKELRELLSRTAHPLNIEELSETGRIYLAATVIGELAALMGWQFNDPRAGARTVALRPLVWAPDAGQFVVAPAMTITLHLPDA